MKSVYESVQDVDLVIGGVTEYPMSDDVLGPTFANIFPHQFLNMRRSDLFFYNFNVDQPTGFRSSIMKWPKKWNLIWLSWAVVLLKWYPNAFWFFNVRSTDRNSKSLFGADHLRQQRWHHRLNPTQSFLHPPRVRIFVNKFVCFIFFLTTYHLISNFTRPMSSRGLLMHAFNFFFFLRF